MHKEKSTVTHNASYYVTYFYVLFSLHCYTQYGGSPIYQIPLYPLSTPILGTSPILETMLKEWKTTFAKTQNFEQ